MNNLLKNIIQDEIKSIKICLIINKMLYIENITEEILKNSFKFLVINK